jgi:hypothetical protein
VRRSGKIAEFDGLRDRGRRIDQIGAVEFLPINSLSFELAWLLDKRDQTVGDVPMRASFSRTVLDETSDVDVFIRPVKAYGAPQ